MAPFSSNPKRITILNSAGLKNHNNIIIRVYVSQVSIVEKGFQLQNSVFGRFFFFLIHQVHHLNP